jgi:tRNA dimethylallyltransferase
MAAESNPTSYPGTETKPTIVIIGGPTASGKTRVGMHLAEIFNGEIVSADSIQIYRHMDVGSAKPTLEERTRVPHHMIDIRNPDEEFSAGDYAREARACIDSMLHRDSLPIVVGGTGLYMRCLLGGIISFPASASGLREKLLTEEKAEKGALYKRLLDVDPEKALSTPPENTYRIMRALEVFELTGKRMRDLLQEHLFRDRPYRYLFVGLAPLRSRLYEQIDQRVDNMIKGGLLEEVAQLYDLGYEPGLKSLQSIGYRHAGMILAGEMDCNEAVELMKRDTRRYAKRQLTWFRSEPDILWCDPQDTEKIARVVDDFLRN